MAKSQKTELIGRFCRDESGATAIEYTLIASLISIAILGSVHMLSDALKVQFEAIANAFPGSEPTAAKPD